MTTQTTITTEQFRNFLLRQAPTEQPQPTMRQRAVLAKCPQPPREPLTTMPIILEGGYYDGEQRDLKTRTTMEISFSMHRQPAYTVTDHYVRTIDICQRTGRTIFRHVGQVRFNTPEPTLLSKILTALGFVKPRRLVF